MSNENQTSKKRELNKFMVFFPLIAMLAIIIVGKGILSSSEIPIPAGSHLYQQRRKHEPH